MWKRVNGGSRAPKIPLTHFSRRKGDTNTDLEPAGLCWSLATALLTKERFFFRKAGWHSSCDPLSWPCLYPRQDGRQGREEHSLSPDTCRTPGGETPVIISLYHQDSSRRETITGLLQMEKLEFGGNEPIAQGHRNNGGCRGVAKACRLPRSSMPCALGALCPAQSKTWTRRFQKGTVNKALVKFSYLSNKYFSC